MPRVSRPAPEHANAPPRVAVHMAGPPATTAPREEPDTDPDAPMFEKIGTDGVEFHQETSPPEAAPANGEDAVDAVDRAAALDPLEPESVQAAPVAPVPAAVDQVSHAHALQPLLAPLLAHSRANEAATFEERRSASASACMVRSPPR